MATSTALYSLSCVLLFLFSSERCNNGGSVPSSPPPIKKALFVLGDSLFDAGNNLYTRNDSKYGHWPYGMAIHSHSTGRVSDGLVVPDFIARRATLPIFVAYLKPGVPHDYKIGANFASAGSSVLRMSSVAIPFQEQMSYLKDVANTVKQKYGEKEGNRILGSAVYLFSIGGNDYFRLSQDLTPSEIYQHVGKVVANITSNLKEVYRLGGRKIAFQNVGALGCTPKSRAKETVPSGHCDEFLLEVPRLHNRALCMALHMLEKTLPGFKYSIFDYYNAILDMGNNPFKYGLKEGKSACCGSGAYRGDGCGVGHEPFEICSNPSECVWFDGGHTTESDNKKLAELMWNGSPQHITGPYTVKQLFESV